MDENARELIKRGDARFSKRAALDTLRQEIALHFCPWHASFTTELTWSEDFAAHLTESTPLLVGRDFIGQLGAMLRPVGKQFFHLRAPHERLNAMPRIRRALDWRSAQMLRIMLDRVTGFSRATKVADEFFGYFGDAVIAVDLSKAQDSMRFRAYHIKDCVWSIGDEGRAEALDRKEKITVRNMRRRFGEKALHEKAAELFERDPDTELEIRHCVLPREEYDFRKKGLNRSKLRFASVWLDVTNQHILRETVQSTFRYVCPRWVTLPHMPYAISPATTIALPDARLIQAQALAILEAAEKSINPPLVAYADTIRGDVRTEAGGITWVDREYDARQGAPVEPLQLGKNPQLGVDVLLRTEAQLNRAFFLDILRMPDTRRTKSEVEVRFLIDEYVRSALPLFAPIEQEYNEQLLSEVHALIELAGGFADGPELPPELRGDVQFQWDNPLSEMIDRQKAQRVGEVSQLAQTVAALEQAAHASAAVAQVDAPKMFRDGMMGLGAADWTLDEDEAAEQAQARQQTSAMQQMVESAPKIAPLIKAGTDAAQVAAGIPNVAPPGFQVPLG